jgi:hypothetical protein
VKPPVVSTILFFFHSVYTYQVFFVDAVITFCSGNEKEIGKLLYDDDDE